MAIKNCLGDKNFMDEVSKHFEEADFSMITNKLLRFASNEHPSS